MSYRWPNKDPDEMLDNTIDWSRLVPSDQTITMVTWYIDDETGVKTTVVPTSTVNFLYVESVSLSGAKTTIILSAGTSGVDYKITCNVLLSGGLSFERSVRMSVKDF